MIAGGKRVVEAGISLSEYIMPGLGGREMSREHAVETAKVLNLIRPDFIRVRTFALPPMSPMQSMFSEGRFTPLGDLEVVQEIRLLLSLLDDMPSHFRCADFSLNLLMHVDGVLSTDRLRMIEEMDRFLSLPVLDQKAYVLLQRSGHCHMHPLDMLKNQSLVDRLREKAGDLERENESGFDRYIRAMMAGQLPRPQTDSWKEG
jgi:hypothetical protein